MRVKMFGRSIIIRGRSLFLLIGLVIIGLTLVDIIFFYNSYVAVFISIAGLLFSLLCLFAFMIEFVLGVLNYKSFKTAFAKSILFLVIFFLFVFLYLSFFPRLEFLIEKRRIAETKETIMEIVVDVESFSKKNGHWPKNKEEIEQFTGESLPASGWKTKVEYFLYEENDFFIRCGSPDGTTLSYFSKNPEEGIVVYGSGSFD